VRSDCSASNTALLGRTVCPKAECFTSRSDKVRLVARGSGRDRQAHVRGLDTPLPLLSLVHVSASVLLQEPVNICRRAIGIQGNNVRIVSVPVSRNPGIRWSGLHTNRASVFGRSLYKTRTADRSDDCSFQSLAGRSSCTLHHAHFIHAVSRNEGRTRPWRSSPYIIRRCATAMPA
jgi:hypothetical protein